MLRRPWTAAAATAAAVVVTLLAGIEAAQAAKTVQLRKPQATTSANLIVDGDVSAGYCTTDWHAATTLPGWTVLSGSPDVICAGAGSFGFPAGTPDQAFYAPGDQGDGAVEQTADVSSAALAIDGGGVGYNLAGWLGGWTSYAGYVNVTLTFLDSSGGQLATASLPTVTAAQRGNKTGFLARDSSGNVPAKTRSIVVELQFVNSSGESGYAEHLSLTLNTPVTAPTLAPPASQVPKFDHVFTVMMENTNYSAIMGDPADTPYLHSLMSQGTTMADYHAVYHPSDENYLAIAGGDTYANGAVYWPNIKDPNANLGDRLEAQGKSWKAYEQGMGTPCNLTTQYDSYYEPDDAPFINYTDVANNSARCQAHLFDTSQLTTDLKSAATTPAFSWIAADDYYDGESSGNGSSTSLKVQDGWLQQTIAPILSSPAWTSQKSLLLLTWDEDTSDAGNHVVTIAVGSQGSVAAGATSDTRYDHYSIGRTIDDALGLPAITANDKYAEPLNDAFTGGTTNPGSTLTPTTSAIQSGQPLTVDFGTPAATATSTNWIGIYPVGVQPGRQPSLTWQYAPGTTGSATFAASSLPSAGTYELWYCYDDGYQVLGGRYRSPLVEAQIRRAERDYALSTAYRLPSFYLSVVQTCGLVSLARHVLVAGVRTWGGCFSLRQVAYARRFLSAPSETRPRPPGRPEVTGW